MHRIAIITAFGVTAVVTGLASAVDALPTAQSQAETGVTLSGDSLRGLENRNADKDFSSFFTGSSLNFPSGNNNNVLTAPNQQGSPLGNLEFRGGSLDNGNNNDPLRFPTADSDQQFRVRYRVNEQ
jgi:hypothetical protein